MLFGVTLGVTLAVDLLVGIAAGIVVDVALNALRERGLLALFRAQVTTERAGDELRVRVDGSANALALLRVLPVLRTASDDATSVVVLDLSGASLVDHTFIARVHGVAREWPRAELRVTGHQHLRPVTAHPLSTRFTPRD